MTTQNFKSFAVRAVLSLATLMGASQAFAGELPAGETTMNVCSCALVPGSVSDINLEACAKHQADQRREQMRGQLHGGMAPPPGPGMALPPPQGAPAPGGMQR